MSRNKADYETFKRVLDAIVRDMRSLAGDTMGRSGESWQDTTSVLAINMKLYADLLTQAGKGQHEAFLVFPSIAEILEEQERAQ